jgi:hypothetical protein
MEHGQGNKAKALNADVCTIADVRKDQKPIILPTLKSRLKTSTSPSSSKLIREGNNYKET